MMKKILTVITFALFTFPSFGEEIKENNDPFSPIPFWVRHAYVMKQYQKWEIEDWQKNFLPNKDQLRSGAFLIPNAKSKVAFSVFKVEEFDFGTSPNQKDYDKNFLIALPEDFETFTKYSLRIRPSLMLDDKWKMTIQKVKIHDGTLEGRLWFERKF